MAKKQIIILAVDHSGRAIAPAITEYLATYGTVIVAHHPTKGDDYPLIAKGSVRSAGDRELRLPL